MIGQGQISKHSDTKTEDPVWSNSAPFFTASCTHVPYIRLPQSSKYQKTYVWRRKHILILSRTCFSRDSLLFKNSKVLKFMNIMSFSATLSLTYKSVPSPYTQWLSFHPLALIRHYGIWHQTHRISHLLARLMCPFQVCICVRITVGSFSFKHNFNGLLQKKAFYTWFARNSNRRAASNITLHSPFGAKLTSY